MAIETTPPPTAATTGTSPAVLGLRCRGCGRPEAVGPQLRLSGLLRAARGRVRPRRRRRRSLTREPIATRRAGHLALPRAPPGRRAAGARPAGRLARPLLAASTASAPRSASTGSWIKDDTRNPTLSFKDRAVAVAAARAVEFGVEALACASTGNLAGATAAAAAAVGPARLRLRPGRPRAGQDRARPRLRRDRRPDRRAPTTTSTGCASRSPTRPAGASSTSTSGRSTPRAARRSPTRSPRRSAGGSPDVVVRRSPRARCSPASRAGFEELVELGLVEREGRSGSSAARRPAARPVATAWAAGDDVIEPVRTPDTIVRSLAIGNPADGALRRRARPARPAARSRRSTTR